jgi:hypothetical protein
VILAVYSYFVSFASAGVDFGIPIVFLGVDFMTRRITPSSALVFISLLAIGALLISTRPTSMFKVCLFSPVKGKVVLKGQPIAGAVIERSCKWNWKKTEQTDQTTTDANGEFSMPGIYSWMGVVQLVPHEPVIHQKIEIKHDGKTYGAWYSYKGDYDEFGELDGVLGGKSIDLLCELEQKSKNHSYDTGGEYGGIGELR